VKQLESPRFPQRGDFVLQRVEPDVDPLRGDPRLEKIVASLAQVKLHHRLHGNTDTDRDSEKW